MRRSHASRRRALGAASILLLAGCSDGATSPDAAGPLTPDEAEVVATALFDEVLDALSTALGRLGLSREAALQSSRTGPPPLTATETFTMTVDERCDLGGRITGSMTITDNTDAFGTGLVSGTLSLNPQRCVVSTGKRSISVDGNPALTYTFGMSFVRDVQSTDFVFRGTGGIRWGQESCTINYTVRITPSGSGSITGTVCDRPVEERFTLSMRAAASNASP
jgi:hypothetical protein